MDTGTMFWTLVLIYSGVCAFGAAFIAEGKDRNSALGFLAGLLFGVFGLMIVIGLVDKRERALLIQIAKNTMPDGRPLPERLAVSKQPSLLQEWKDIDGEKPAS